MSYGASTALQSALYAYLQEDPDINAQVDGAIFDALPSGELPETYVLLGEEEVRDASSVSGGGSEHRVVISVITDQAGFAKAKDTAGAISEALERADLTLGRGHLVGLWFYRAQARRSGRAGRQRRIDLRYRARIENN